MSRRSLQRLLAAGALLFWFALFAHTETTEQSMVRAVLLEQSGEGWSVGLLYQFPEASADSSEAEATIRLCSAQGASLEQAFTEAERLLPQRANYRLCDHLLFGADSTADTLAVCENFFLDQPRARISARVFGLSFSVEELAQAESEMLPERLLLCAKAHAALAPRLYENASGCLVPVLSIEGDSSACEDAGRLLTQNTRIALTAEQTEMALLLAGKGKTHTFSFDSGSIELERALCSVCREENGFLVQLTCRRKAGAADAVQCEQLEALCTETLRLFWTNGVDWLRLGAVQALCDGTLSLTTKSACPELRTDVEIYG